MTSLVALVALGPIALLRPVEGVETECPIMRGRPTTGRFAVDTGVRRTYLCCDMCVRTAVRGAERQIARAVEGGAVVGHVLFDMTTGRKVGEKGGVATAVHAGYVWHFESEAGKARFLAEADRMAKAPDRESMACPACGTALRHSGAAFGFVDVDGVRVFLATEGCFRKAQADPGILGKAEGAPVRARAVPVAGIDFSEG